MQFDDNSAEADLLNRFNDTEPTTSVFTVGDADAVNKSSETYINYLWRSVQGFSKFGSYTANNSSNGTFIYLGFRPALFICKKYSGTESWYINDNKRSTYNPTKAEIFADDNQAESTANTRIDLLSNGVKMRTDNGGYNYSNNTYLYMAFAEQPFVNSSGVPCNARWLNKLTKLIRGEVHYEGATNYDYM